VEQVPFVTSTLNEERSIGKFTGAVFPVSRTQTDPLKLAELIEKVAATRVEGVDLHEFTWDRIRQHLLRVYSDIRQN
jgi:hypothetical protein